MVCENIRYTPKKLYGHNNQGLKKHSSQAMVFYDVLLTGMILMHGLQFIILNVVNLYGLQGLKRHGHEIL